MAPVKVEHHELHEMNGPGRAFELQEQSVQELEHPVVPVELQAHQNFQRD